MENKSNNSGLKAAVVVLALLFLGSVGYIFKLNSDNKETVTTLTTEKNTLSEELKAKIAEYDTMIADNTALKDELQAEQAKMVALLEQVENDFYNLEEEKRVVYTAITRPKENLVIWDLEQSTMSELFYKGKLERMIDNWLKRGLIDLDDFSKS